MATNNFKAFGIGVGANVTSQADYEALSALLTGFQSGKASSAQINKAIRQSSTMANVLAQFISDSASVDVLDNGNPATILANLKSGLTALTPGRLIKIQYFTASGTYTPTPGTKKAIVRGVGGGGGGGGCPATTSSQQSTSGGGQSGAYAELSLDSLLSSYAITVGSPGTAGTKTPTAGGSGGATVMAGVVTIPGGAGGYAGAAVTPTISVGSITNGTVYPTVTSGTLRIAFPASAGQPALILGSGTNQAKGGVGGSSPFGVGGQGGLGGAPGSVGLGYGAAGGGCSQLASNNGDVGGPGTSGYLEIWEYA